MAKGYEYQDLHCRRRRPHKTCFGLVDDWKIIEKSPTEERMISIEVTLSEWLHNAVAVRELLTLNRDYSDSGSAGTSSL